MAKRPCLPPSLPSVCWGAVQDLAEAGVWAVRCVAVRLAIAGLVGAVVLQRCFLRLVAAGAWAYRFAAAELAVVELIWVAMFQRRFQWLAAVWLWVICFAAVRLAVGPFVAKWAKRALFWAAVGAWTVEAAPRRSRFFGRARQFAAFPPPFGPDQCAAAMVCLCPCHMVRMWELALLVGKRPLLLLAAILLGLIQLARWLVKRGLPPAAARRGLGRRWWRFQPSAGAVGELFAAVASSYHLLLLGWLARGWVAG